MPRQRLHRLIGGKISVEDYETFFLKKSRRDEIFA
jgi:hypothetical protein